jgi:hypothetical protein
MKTDATIIYILGIGCVLGAIVSFPLVKALQPNPSLTERQTQWTQASSLPSTIELEGVIQAYDSTKKELTITAQLPYNAEKSASFNLFIPEKTYIAVARETYGPEGTSIVYKSEDALTNESEFISGRPVYVQLHRDELRFSTILLRVFVPLTST